MKSKPTAKITMEVQTPTVTLMIVPELDTSKIGRQLIEFKLAYVRHVYS